MSGAGAGPGTNPDSLAPNPSRVRQPHVLCLKMMRPRLRSYGETSIVTRSPCRTRIRKRLMLPPSVASTVCPLVSNTRNVAFGSTSVTCPSSCIGSSLAMSPRLAVPLCSALARSAALAPSRGSRLELPRLARLHVVPLLAKILENAGLGDAPLEHLECPIQTITFFDLDLDHVLSSLLAMTR